MFRLRQPVWAFGRIDDGIDFADQELLADQRDLLRVQRDLLEQTVSAYIQVLSLQSQQQVAQENITRHQQLFERIQRRHQGQLASIAEVNLANIRLKQANAKAQKLAGELRLQLTELSSLIEQPVEQVTEVDKEFLHLPSLTDIETKILINSAEVLYKQQLIAVAKAEAERAWSNAMPTVYLQADKYLNQLGYRNGVQYSLMLEGSLDGMGLSASGRVKAANARITASEQTLAVAEEDLLRQARSFYQQIHLHSDLTQMYGQTVEQVQSVIDSYSRQYEAGRKTWIEVLNMHKEYTDQRLSQVQSEYQWQLFALRLKTLLGSLDNTTPETKGHF